MTLSQSNSERQNKARTKINYKHYSQLSFHLYWKIERPTPCSRRLYGASAFWDRLRRRRFITIPIKAPLVFGRSAPNPTTSIEAVPFVSSKGVHDTLSAPLLLRVDTYRHASGLTQQDPLDGRERASVRSPLVAVTYPQHGQLVLC
jgi:hypothetical protein